MSKSKGAIPDAWDDEDWEAQADKLAAKPPTPEPVVKLTRSERKAKHEEANRQMWEDAEKIKDQPIFLQARTEPALKSEFKPTMKVLTRKPPSKIASRGDTAIGIRGLTIEDGDDSEEEERQKQQALLDKMRAEALSPEEKQRRYEQRRAELGLTPTSSSVAAGAGSRSSSKDNRRSGRNPSSRDTIVKATSPGRPAGQRKQLFDPNYSEKPGSGHTGMRRADDSGRSTPSNEQRPIRAPKGPDADGGGGFGFSLRGGNSSSTET